MATMYAQSRIKHDGDVIEPGEKVSKSSFGDSWDALVEAGAVGPNDPTATEEEAEEEAEAPEAPKEATVADLMKRAGELEIEGRTNMNKAELEKAIAEAEG